VSKKSGGLAHNVDASVYKPKLSLALTVILFLSLATLTLTLTLTPTHILTLTLVKSSNQIRIFDVAKIAGVITKCTEGKSIYE